MQDIFSSLSSATFACFVTIFAAIQCCCNAMLVFIIFAAMQCLYFKKQNLSGSCLLYKRTPDCSTVIRSLKILHLDIVSETWVLRKLVSRDHLASFYHLNYSFVRARFVECRASLSNKQITTLSWVPLLSQKIEICRQMLFHANDCFMQDKMCCDWTRIVSCIQWVHFMCFVLCALEIHSWSQLYHELS